MTSIEAIVNRQFLRWELEQTEARQTADTRPCPAPIVTISRQTGSRGSYFGSRLAQRLGYQRLHQEAIDLICKSSGYRKRIVESLDGKLRSRLELLAESILTGKAIDQTDYARQLCRVLLTMSELGGVVLIGRGGNFILGPKRGFHLRVICPRDRRIENLIKYKQLDATEAAATIDRSDADRQEYIATLFGAHIDDPHQYDLAINTSLMDVEDMVNMTMVAIQAKMSKLTYLDHDQA
jgi:cytidylate kinase